MKKLLLTVLVVLCFAPLANAQIDKNDARIREVQELLDRYNKAGDYQLLKDADSRLESAETYPDITVAQKKITEKLRKEINTAKNEAAIKGEIKKILSGIRDIEIDPKNESRQLTFWSKYSWSVEPVEKWCVVLSSTKTSCVLACSDNDGESRSTSVKIKVDDQEKTIVVTQAHTNEKYAKVLIKVEPNVPIVMVDDINPIAIDKPVSLNTGDHKISITKDGYHDKDTTIHISQGNMNEIMTIPLTPKFGRIKVSLPSDQGTTFTEYPVMSIGPDTISLSPIINNNYINWYSDSRIKYFQLYEGGSIPVPAGSYDIVIASGQYENISEHVDVEAGEVAEVNALLKRSKGVLKIECDINSVDADIVIDGKLIGRLPCDNIDLPTGEYIVTFNKKGYSSDSESYTAVIRKNNITTLSLSMKSFITFKIGCNLDHAKVFIDNNTECVGYAPLTQPFYNGQHTIIVKKEGYEEKKYSFSVGSEESGEREMQFILKPVYPLFISSDETGLRLFLTGEGMKDSLVGTTPVSLDLPAGKYKVKMMRGIEVAYKGPMSYDGKSVNRNFLTYPDSYFHILSGNYYFMKPASSDLTNYNLIGSLGFGNFKLFSGFSTSIAKVSLFQSLSGVDAIYPNNLLSVSCFFLNDDFRIGGGVHKNVDVNALLSYTWNPIMSWASKKFSHVYGHEAFIGAEVSSRMKIFNLNIRAGWHMYKGHSTVYKEDVDRRITDGLSISRFDVSLGFTLGGRLSKGNNLLRVF